MRHRRGGQPAIAIQQNAVAIVHAKEDLIEAVGAQTLFYLQGSSVSRPLFEVCRRVASSQAALASARS